MELRQKKSINMIYNYVEILILEINLRKNIGSCMKTKEINFVTIIKIYKFKDLEIVLY